MFEYGMDDGNGAGWGESGDPDARGTVGVDDAREESGADERQSAAARDMRSAHRTDFFFLSAKWRDII
jgi:hypothetical protein